jgi:hypothetical protein
VVGAAEQVGGRCVGRLEPGLSLVVAVDVRLAESRADGVTIAGPRSQRAAQRVRGEQAQGSPGIAALDRAAGGVEDEARGAVVDEPLPPGAILEVVDMRSRLPAERVGDLQQVAIDVVGVAGGQGRVRGPLGVLDDPAERVDQVTGGGVPVRRPRGRPSRVGAAGVVVLVVPVGLPRRRRVVIGVGQVRRDAGHEPYLRPIRVEDADGQAAGVVAGDDLG